MYQNPNELTILWWYIQYCYTQFMVIIYKTICLVEVYIINYYLKDIDIVVQDSVRNKAVSFHGF